MWEELSDSVLGLWNGLTSSSVERSSSCLYLEMPLELSQKDFCCGPRSLGGPGLWRAFLEMCKVLLWAWDGLGLAVYQQGSSLFLPLQGALCCPNTSVRWTGYLEEEKLWNTCIWGCPETPWPVLDSRGMIWQGDHSCGLVWYFVLSMTWDGADGMLLICWFWVHPVVCIDRISKTKQN